MALFERNRLIFTLVAVTGLGVITGAFIGGSLLPLQAAEQYNEDVMTLRSLNMIVHSHEDFAAHEHELLTEVLVTETTPHGYFHDYAASIVPFINSQLTASFMTQRANEVWVNNNEFLPQILTIPVGATVTWTNIDNQEHTVTLENGLFRVLLTARGTSGNYTFKQTGIFPYYCEPHDNMQGKIIVK